MDTWDLIALVIGFVWLIVRWYLESSSRDTDVFYDNYDAGYIDEQRRMYEARLKQYYEDYKPRLYLKNDFCELKLILNGANTFLYCKEKFEGRYFEVKGNIEHCNTMWGIFDMEFDKTATYDTIKHLYRDLNNNLSFFKEKLIDGYPHINNKIAQNEYCRMELKEDENKNLYILCYDLWGESPFQFIINKSEKYSLMRVIREFREEKSVLMTLSELLWQYEKRGYEIKLIREPADLNTPRIRTDGENITYEEQVYTKEKPLYGMPVLKNTSTETDNVTQNDEFKNEADLDINIESTSTFNDKNQDETEAVKKFKERNIDL